MKPRPFSSCWTERARGALPSKGPVQEGAVSNSGRKAEITKFMCYCKD